MIQDSEKLAYLAGWIASDGHVECNPQTGRHVGFYLHERDRDVLDQFALWFGGTVKTYTYDKPIAKWICWDRDVYDWALAGNFKHQIVTGSDLEQRRFLQGFLEGDGHVGFRQNGQFRLTFTNESASLLSAVMSHLELALQLEPKALHKRGDNTHQVTYETRMARIIAWYLYHDAKFFLQRKKEVVDRLWGTETDPLGRYLKVVFDHVPLAMEKTGGLLLRMFLTKDSWKAAKTVCAGAKHIGVKATPVPYGKGSDKYWGVYFPEQYKDHLLIHMQGMSVVKQFPGKVRLLDAA